MIRKRVLRQVGGSVMVAIPPQMLRHLGARANDEVCVVIVDGGLLLTIYTPAVERVLESLEKMHRSTGQGIRRLVTPAAERP